MAADEWGKLSTVLPKTVLNSTVHYLTRRSGGDLFEARI